MRDGGRETDQADDAGSGSEAGRAGQRRWSFLTEAVVLFAVALVIALLTKTFVVQPFYIPSASMEDTLLIGDKVLVNKIVYRIRPISRGDVVVFSGTGSWDPPAPPPKPSRNPLARFSAVTVGRLVNEIEGLFGDVHGQTDYIKRVIGVPGDHVACCNAHGQITVNGVALHEKAYVIPGARPSQGSFSIVVPPGRLWVMGDNRPDSEDSRMHDCAYASADRCERWDRNGTIGENHVIGRAFMIVWPPSRVRILPIPATFAQPGLLHVAGGSASAAPGQPGRILVRPAAPYLPLAAGIAAAVPVAMLRRGGGGRGGRRGHSRSRRPGSGPVWAGGSRGCDPGRKAALAGRTAALAHRGPR